MSTTERELLPDIAEPSVENVACPPHHWMITGGYEDGYREERWECRRCGDARFTRTPVWASSSRRMANTSTWTPEDKIIGGDDDAETL
jgi:hypothetical protein